MANAGSGYLLLENVRRLKISQSDRYYCHERSRIAPRGDLLSTMAWRKRHTRAFVNAFLRFESFEDAFLRVQMALTLTLRIIKGI